jgi:hypothetical protein
MSFLNVAAPVFDFAAVARPLIGFGFLGTFALVFEPLLKGVLRAALLMMVPRRSRAQVKASADFESIADLYRIARNCEESAPSLAAELRAVACRG